MKFETEFQCVGCGAAYIVYPAYATVAKVKQRSLPAWKRCECAPRFQEITTAEFGALVPGWEDIMDPGDPNEMLEE